MKYITTYCRENEHDLKGREDFPEKREGERNPKGITVCKPKTSKSALR